MNPDLEFFLEEVFDPIQPTSQEIGRVVVVPDYDAELADADRPELAKELVRCLQEWPAGAQEIQVDAKYPTLKKYILSITPHAEKLEGAWIEVAPPGNWI